MKKNNFKLIIGVVLLIIVMAISCYLIIPIFNNTNYGLDLQGGFEVLYEIDSLDDKPVTNDMVYNTYKAILKRIDLLGVNEPEITIEDNNRIRIALAGIKNEEEARQVLSSTATLSFRDANDNLLMTSDVLNGGVKVTNDQYGRPAINLPIKDKDKFYEVTNKVKDMTNNVIVIWLDFDETKDSFIKEKDVCGSLSSSKCLSAARIGEAFASDVIIQGNFTVKEAKALTELINSGALPTKLNEISSRTVEATYGSSSLSKTIFAGIIGIVIVLILLITLYHFSGLIASCSLVLYTMLSLLVFKLIGGVLTLPGIAAMLLGIGMAVDAAVITFERIKGQLKQGKNLKEAVSIGNKESLSSIIDANLTTMIVAIILFIFGQSSVKGFATMLIINIILTILILVFLTKYIINIFSKSEFFSNKINLFIGLSKKKINNNIVIPFKKIDFVKQKRFVIPFVIILILFGSIYSYFTKFNLAVDFTGGTSITVNTTKKIVLDKYNIVKESASKENTTYIISEKLNKEEIQEMANYLEKEYNTTSNIFIVSDMVKKELTKNAIISIIISLIGIILYVSIRFKFNYAISGIVALIHDTVITILFFGIFKLQIDSTFIAAILTIIGYSINDTIVTFDMVRENYSKKKSITSDTLKDIINDSIRLTFSRTIMTTLTTIIPVICLIIFGSSEIYNFNIALLIGFIAGVFSSIYISNILWLYLEKRKLLKPKKEPKKEEVEELKIKGINC